MDRRTELIEAGKKLLHEGFTVETWGNISLRDDSGRIYITPSGMDYDSCTAEDIVVMNLEGRILAGKRKPSIEAGLHLAVYRARPEIGAIVHTHPIASLAFACTGEHIPLLTDEAAQALGAEVKTAAYGLPGSGELAESCVAALGDKAMACLLQSHGAVCLGADMKAAFKTARVLEMTAEVYYRIKAMGGSFLPISEGNIRAMQEFVATKYGQR